MTGVPPAPASSGAAAHQPVVDAGLGHLALDLLQRLGERRPVAHAGRHREDEAPRGLALEAAQEAVDVDLLVGAQAFGARRHLHLERLALGREADRVAQLGIAERDGSRVLLALDATHLAARRQGQRAQQREGEWDQRAQCWTPALHMRHRLRDDGLLSGEGCSAAAVPPPVTEASPSS